MCPQFGILCANVFLFLGNLQNFMLFGNLWRCMHDMKDKAIRLFHGLRGRKWRDKAFLFQKRKTAHWFQRRRTCEVRATAPASDFHLSTRAVRRWTNRWCDRSSRVSDSIRIGGSIILSLLRSFRCALLNYRFYVLFAHVFKTFHFICEIAMLWDPFLILGLICIGIT